METSAQLRFKPGDVVYHITDMRKRKTPFEIIAILTRRERARANKRDYVAIYHKEKITEKDKAVFFRDSELLRAPKNITVNDEWWK